MMYILLAVLFVLVVHDVPFFPRLGRVSLLILLDRTSLASESYVRLQITVENRGGC